MSRHPHQNDHNALVLVLSGIERNGPNDTDTLVLEVEDEDGELMSTTLDKNLQAWQSERSSPDDVRVSRSSLKVVPAHWRPAVVRFDRISPR